MKTVLEVIFIAILVSCVWSGYKKGLILTAGSILVIVISLFAGDLLSDTFSHEVIPVIQPFVSGYMEGSEGAITEALSETMGTGVGMGGLSTEDAVAQHPEKAAEFCKLSYTKLGIYDSTAEVMAQQAMDMAEANSQSLNDSIVEVMCNNLTYYVGFILFFTISAILLTVVGNITNLSFKIPYIGKFDSALGAAAGLVVGIMFCLLAGWMLKFTGILLPEDELGTVAGLFAGMDTYSKFLSI